jgi:hypothetical protein
MRNKRKEDDTLIDFFGKTQRKKPRIGVLHTKREEKPMKRIMQHIEDEEEALAEIDDFLYGDYYEYQ